MIKLMILLKRKPGMSDEDFYRYWRENHGNTVMGTKEFFRHVRRYVQSHKKLNAKSGFSSSESEYDGVAEFWFDDVESMNRAFSEPKYLEIVQPDEPKFVDLDACRVLVVEELPKFTPPGSAAET